MKAVAYSILCDMSSFPEYMPNVLSVTERSLSETKSLVEWRCSIDGAPFAWTQENTYDRDHHAVHFSLLEGEFDELHGSWLIEDAGDALALKLRLQYALELPVIEDVLGPILKEKLHSNSTQMLNHVRERMVVHVG
jgi:ribosome-associated toxin RatA of RatAB toxin-antitoxin module